MKIKLTSANTVFLSAIVMTILLLLYLTFFSDLPVGSIKFVKEDIYINVSPETLNIRGLYQYRSNSFIKSKHTLFYPFYLGPDSLFPTYFSVKTDDSHLDYKQDEDIMKFELQISNNHDAVVEVIYEQPLTGNNAVYLTETTQYWDDPVKKANFYIKLSEKIKDATVTTPFNEISSITDQKEFTYTDFYPMGNFIVKWEKQNG